MVIAKSLDFFNFDPAPGPATKKSIFLLIELLVLPPFDATKSFASFRLNSVKVPVNTNTLSLSFSLIGVETGASSTPKDKHDSTI